MSQPRKWEKRKPAATSIQQQKQQKQHKQQQQQQNKHTQRD